MLYRTRQPAYPPLFTAVGCICIAAGTTLLLKRAAGKSYPYHWGIPGGKVDPGETNERAVIRELFEETGILTSSANLRRIGILHVVNADMSFLYDLYVLRLDRPPRVRITDEHEASGWYSAEDLSSLDLVPDLRECFYTAGFLPSLEGTQLALFPTVIRRNARSSLSSLESGIRHDLSANYRSLIEQGSRPYLVAYGPPCSGKSTALREMNQRNPDHPLVIDSEPLRRGSRLHYFLQRIFLRGDNSLLFQFQVDALAIRFSQHLGAPPESLVDESIYSNHAYTRALRMLNWISVHQYQTAFQAYLLYDALLPRSQRLLYFSADRETLQSRMRSRKRQHEQFYTTEYIEALGVAFDDLADELAARHEVLRVDTTNISSQEVAERYGPAPTR